MPVIWRFRYFKPPGEKGDVRAAYDDGGRELQSRFLSRLKTLAGLPLDEWHEGYRKVLNGYDGLEELRFKANKVQQRPLGFRSGDNEFTILYWATEKGGKFVPRSAPAKALERRDLVLQDGSLTDAIWLALE